MKTSETINELAAALAKAQGAMSNATLNKENPYFKSKYADLAGIRDTVTPALSANGLSISQFTEIGDGILIVCTRLIHASGQWIESQYPIINDTNKPQAMGSAMTYARRYSLSAICGISSEADDDGNEAADHGKKPAEVRNIAGTPKASKAMSREQFTQLVSDAKLATTLEGLKDWLRGKKADIAALPPDWADEFGDQYAQIREALEAKAA